MDSTDPRWVDHHYWRLRRDVLSPHRLPRPTCIRCRLLVIGRWLARATATFPRSSFYWCRAVCLVLVFCRWSLGHFVYARLSQLSVAMKTIREVVGIFPITAGVIV